MKKFTIIILCLSVATRVFGQDCAHFPYMQKNRSIEMTSYDANGKPGVKSVTTVTGVNTVNGVTTATANVEAYDAKGKLLVTSKTNYRCDGSGLAVEMSFATPQGGGMNVSNKSNYTAYPTSMSVGQHLPDAVAQMDWGNGMIVTTKVTNRMVVAKESVTTPAGTFECYKITSTTTSSSAPAKSGDSTSSLASKMANLRFAAANRVRTSQTTLWYELNVGMVKVQTQTGTMVLTSIK